MTFNKSFCRAAAAVVLTILTANFSDAAETTLSAARGAEGMTAVTYMPPVMQSRAPIAKEKMTQAGFGEFFLERLTVPENMALNLQKGPMPASEALTPSSTSIHRFIEEPDAEDWGYTVLDGATVHVRSHVDFPGSTPEMFRWWFAWHPLESTRYMIWFPQAHVSIKAEDPDRLANQSLSFEERFYNNRHHVVEYLGAYKLECGINFLDPAQLGIDLESMRKAGFEVSASALLEAADHPDITIGLMLHLVRPTETGMELYSCYWLGNHPALSRFPGADKAKAILDAAGINETTAEALAYELAIHDMTEYTNLSQLLPKIYEKYGSKQ